MYVSNIPYIVYINFAQLVINNTTAVIFVCIYISVFTLCKFFVIIICIFIFIIYLFRTLFGLL